MTALDLSQGPQGPPQAPISDEEAARRVRERRQQLAGQGPPQQGPETVSDEEAAKRVRERRQQTAEDLAMANYRVAVRSNPDERAKAQQIARELGASVDNVEENHNVFRQYHAIQQQQRQALWSQNPVLARQMGDMEFARIAHDDTEMLSYLERVFRQWDLGILDREQGVLGQALRNRTATPQDLDRLAFVRARLKAAHGAEGFVQGSVRILGLQYASVPEALKYGVATASGMTAGVLLSGQLEAAPLIPAAFVAGTVGGLAIESYRIESGSLFLDLMDNLSKNGTVAVSEHDRSTAARLSMAGGLANAFLELTGEAMIAKGAGLAWDGTKVLLRDQVKVEIAKQLARPTIPGAIWKAAVGTAMGAGGEIVTETGQEGVNIAVEEIARQLSEHPELIENTVTRGEVVKRLVDTAVQTAQGMLLLAIPGPALRLIHDVRQAQNAEHTAQFWAELGTTRDKSKLAARDVGAAEKFLLAASKGTSAENTYIDGLTAQEVLQQADEEAAQAGQPSLRSKLEASIPGITAAIHQAATNHQDLVVPTGTVGARIAGTELYAKLLPHLRLSAEAVSLAQAQKVLARQQQLQDQATTLLEEAETANKAFSDSAREVEDGIRKQLVAAGRAPAAAAEEARLYRDLVVVMADKRKLLPTEVHAEAPLQVKPGELAAEPAVHTELDAEIGPYDRVAALHGNPLADAMRAWDNFDEVRTFGAWPAEDVAAEASGGMAVPVTAEPKSSATPGSLWTIGLFAEKALRSENLLKEAQRRGLEVRQVGQATPDGKSLWFVTGQAGDLQAFAQSTTEQRIPEPAEVKARMYPPELREIQESRNKRGQLLRFRNVQLEAMNYALKTGITPAEFAKKFGDPKKDKAMHEAYAKAYQQKQDRGGFEQDEGAAAAQPEPAATPPQRAALVKPPKGWQEKTEVPPGAFAVKTQLVETSRQAIGKRKVRSVEDAADAMSYLSQGAVERFDAMVTDQDGNVLAIIGGFKGAVDVTAIQFSTVMLELARIKGATDIWFGHNHPSGRSTLSPEDRQVYLQFQALLEGTGIRPRGIFAFGSRAKKGERGEYSYAHDDVNLRGFAKDRGGKKGASAPRLEREITERATLSPVPIRHGDDAAAFARAALKGLEGSPLAAANHLIVLMDSTSTPVAIVPVPRGEALQLRTPERLERLMSAIALTNASSAFVVQPVQKDDPATLVGDPAEGQNLARFLSNFVRVLDVIVLGPERHFSWSQQVPETLTRAASERLVFEQHEGIDWADYQPARTKAGDYRGAPEWVKQPQDLRELRRVLAQLLEEGTPTRFWYENSVQQALVITKGDVAKAEKFLQLLAIYSANSNVWTNSINAVRAYNHWVTGKPSATLHAALTTQDQKARNVLYHDLPWEGRKTSSFYLNLLFELKRAEPEQVAALNLDRDLLAKLEHAATVDIWMYRAMGYKRDQGGDDVGTGKYSFTENELRRLAARLNQSLAPGAQPWTSHEVQAAIWGAIRTRYNIEHVKNATNEKGVAQGLIKLVVKKGKREWKYPNTAKQDQKHMANWRGFAMAVPGAEVKARITGLGRSFADELVRMTETVTWEAMPSPDLKHPLLQASPEVQEQFLLEAHALLIGENGEDLLAEQLGIGLHYSTLSYGAWGDVNRNVLAHILPSREIGKKGFTREQVNTYARAIQYIYSQKAVPWVRLEAVELEAAAAKEAQQFYVVDGKGRRVPNSGRALQADAQLIANQLGPDYQLRGGKLARSLLLTLDQPPSRDTLTAVLRALQQHLGPDAGFTRLADDRLLIVNYRGDGTGVPFARTDEEFLSKLGDFMRDEDDSFGITNLEQIWTEGRYGTEQNWLADPTGATLLQGGLAGSAVGHGWLRDRRDAYLALLGRYDPAGIQATQAALDLQAEAARELEARQEAAVSEGAPEPAAPKPRLAFLAEEPGEGITRGFYRPRDFTIFLTKQQNESTFVHELAHHYLHILSRLATDKAHPDLLDDWNTTLQWFGVPSTEAWHALGLEGQKAHHEAFARSFELWLWSGKAPSARLEGVFSRVAAWMRRVYGSVVGGINAKYRAKFGRDLPALTPEVQRVFARMLASEHEIKQTEAVTRMAESFESQAQAGMGDAEWRAHQDLEAEASNTAIDQHTRDSLKALAWYRNAQARVDKEFEQKKKKAREQARAELEPQLRVHGVHRVRTWLRSGEMIDVEGGTGMQLGGVHKIRTADVLPLLPAGTDPKLLQGRNGIMQKDGLPLDTVTKLFGYPDGRALLTALLTEPQFEQVLEQAIDARMEAMHGELVDPKLREAAVNRALHNEARSRLIGVDLKHLDKALGPVNLLLRATREQAKKQLDRQTVGNVSPRQHTLAEARLAKEFREAMQEGDIGRAATAQRARLLHHELAKAAAGALDEIDEAHNDLLAFSGRDEDIAKLRDIDLVYVGRQLAAAFGIGEAITNVQQRSLIAKARDKVRQEHRVLSDRVDALLDLQLGSGRGWRDLTVAELRELAEVGNALWWQASKVRLLERQGRRVQVATVAAAGIEQLKTLQPRAESARSTTRTKGALGRAVLRGWQLLANLKRFSHWAHFMDKGKQGFFHEHFVQPISEALGPFWAKRKDVAARFAAKLLPLYRAAGALWDADIAVPEARFAGPGGLVLRGKKEVLGLLAQAGTESNLEKSLVPYGFALPPEQTGDVLDTSNWDAFLARMFKQGVLTQQDVLFVQSLWDLYEELLPADQATHKLLHGAEYATIPPREVHTPFGTLKGGYVPAMADQDKIQNPRPNSVIESLAGEEQAIMYSISTGKGHTIKRNPFYRKPLNLNVAAQLQHIDAHLRYTYLQPAIANILRLIRNRDFSDALNGYDREAVNSIILPMLDNLALQQSSRPSSMPLVDTISNWVRSGTSLAVLGLNLFNSALQLTGFGNALNGTKGRYMLAGVGTFLQNPMAAVRDTMARSPFMDERLELNGKRLRQDIARVARVSSVKGFDETARAGRALQQWAARLAFWPQRMLQGIVDVVTWQAAYQQSIAASKQDLFIDDKAIEADAVRFADEMVKRTQGSSNPEDLAGYESGTPGAKLLTQFSSYSNVVFNSILGGQPGFGPKLRAVWWALLVPTFAEIGLRLAAYGAPDDDKDGEKELGEVLLLAGKTMARNATGLIPVAGPMLNTLAESEGTRVLSSPAATLLQQTVAGIYAAADAVTGDDDVTATQARAIGALVTLITGLPVMPLARAAAYDIKVREGKVRPSGPIDYARGLLLGR